MKNDLPQRRKDAKEEAEKSKERGVEKESSTPQFLLLLSFFAALRLCGRLFFFLNAGTGTPSS
jgi:hypothetical protein